LEVVVASLFDDDYVIGLYRGKIPIYSVLKAYVSRVKFMLRAKHFDLVWVEKEMLPWMPAWIEFGLFPRNVSLVVDYDDAVFHRYDQHSFSLVRLLLGHKIDAVMRRADLVIVGNDYLGERARRAGARHVKLLPTVVDTSRYTVSHTNPDKPVTIGWIGSPSTARYLHLVAPVLQKMIVSHGIRVVAIGANPAQLKALPFEVRSWSEDAEVEEIKRFDIGIMPLPDEPFARGKCGYKLIQYMACGKPVVASPVGVNSVIVRHGINGYLAGNESEWVQSLHNLLNDSALRLQMGNNGRTLVEVEYSLQITAPFLANLLRTIKGI
jgi:glycosyltransferase involved in cell wall biosynthesis